MMRLPRFPSFFAAHAVLFLLSACAGSGEGLDENGRPLDDGAPAPAPGPITADFQSIQDQIFTPVCTRCHAGAGAPVGLRLEEGVSYDMLVGVASVEVPELQRVDPGEPDTSYLLQKIAGTATAGDRMPLPPAPALSAEQVAAVRQWIADGAPPAVSAKSDGGGAVSIRNAFAINDGALVALTHELDASSVHAASVELSRELDGGGFIEVPLNESHGGAQVLRSFDNPNAVLLQLPAGAAASYRLRLHGSGPAPLADLRGMPIDGDGDGVPGGDFDFYFERGERR